MSKIQVFQRVKRHLELGNYLKCVFVAEGKAKGRLILISKKKKRIVQAFMTLQLFIILLKLWSISGYRFRSLTENVVGIAIVSLTGIPFILGFDPSPENVQVQFLNGIFSAKGM